MKRLISFAAILLGLCYSVAAQVDSSLEQLRLKMAANASIISYDYSLSLAGTKTTGSGVLTVQDKVYKMVGNGLRISCDGSIVCLVDEAAKEIFIESISQGDDAFLSNPVLLFANLNSVFSISDPVKKGSELVYNLTPKKTCGLDSGIITLNTTGAIPVFTSGSFKITDGGQLDVKIKSMTFVEKKPLTFYSVDLSGYDSSWMISDLR